MTKRELINNIEWKLDTLLSVSGPRWTNYSNMRITVGEAWLWLNSNPWGEGEWDEGSARGALEDLIDDPETEVL